MNTPIEKWNPVTGTWDRPSAAGCGPMTYDEQHAALVRYLAAKTEQGDWHAVRDAAVDIEIMEAEHDNPTDRPDGLAAVLDAGLEALSAEPPSDAILSRLDRIIAILENVERYTRTTHRVYTTAAL